MRRRTNYERKTAAESANLPQWLERSRIYKRLPLKARQKLNAALLSGATDSASLAAIAADLKLTTYGISAAVVKKYAVRLEQWIRPSLTEQLLAGVLGCMPRGYRRQVLDGSQVLLLSRVLQALTRGDERGKHLLPAADLAKLASILTAFGRREKPPSKASGKPGSPDDKMRPNTPIADDTLAGTVRRIYGLTWPVIPKGDKFT